MVGRGLNPENVGAGYGWVDGQYTTASNVENIQMIKNPVTYQTAPPPPPPAGVPVATAVDYVNVRSGPGTSYPVLVVAPPGAAGEVTGKSADGAWWQVKISTQYSADGFGWVSADWVYTQDTDSVPVVAAPAPPPTRRDNTRTFQLNDGLCLGWRNPRRITPNSRWEQVSPPPGCCRTLAARWVK